MELLVVEVDDPEVPDDPLVLLPLPPPELDVELEEELDDDEELDELDEDVEVEELDVLEEPVLEAPVLLDDDPVFFAVLLLLLLVDVEDASVPDPVPLPVPWADDPLVPPAPWLEDALEPFFPLAPWLPPTRPIRASTSHRTVVLLALSIEPVSTT